MVFRIEVGLRKELADPMGKTLLRRIRNDFNISAVTGVRVLKVYLIDVSGATSEMARKFASDVLSDPITELFAEGEALAGKNKYSWIAETGFMPGVTDNEGKTAIWGFQKYFNLKLSPGDAIYSGRKYLFSGDVKKDDIDIIASGLLANKLIQRYKIIGSDEWEKGVRVGDTIPKVTGTDAVKVENLDLNVADAELENISSQRVLALSLEEMKAAQSYFASDKTLKLRKKKGFPELPTDCEVEVIAQTWSEHCKHKIFAGEITYTDKTTGKTIVIDSLFKSYIKRVTQELLPEKPWVKSVFDDNAGIIEIDNDNLLAMKVETHNSPSALDPYGGALTGIVGVNRDIIGCGIGAKPIFNIDVFCFASPFYKGNLPGSNLLHPARIFRGVHQGVKDGGNESGIPVVNGSIFFDNRFVGKPMVFCGTGGLMPLKVNGQPAYYKKARKGDLIVMVGGRVGKDGIHGATFSSEELHEGSPVTAVQIGDPIVQKRMLDFIMEARDKGLYTGITDNGAGGLSSSVGEMAGDTGGAVVNLDKVPLKYSGLQPWEIFVSEAQERMTLSVTRSKMEELQKIAAIHEVEVTAIGEFTDSGSLEIYYRDIPVALIEMEFLHKGVPKYRLEAIWEPKETGEYELPECADYNSVMLDMMGRLNIASKEEWVRQYDHEVQGRSAGKPFCGKEFDGPSDAGVIRISPFSKTAIVVSHGIKPTFSDIDAYWMTASVIDEAVRNAVASGADPDFMSGLDNFCWPDPVYNKKKNPDGHDKCAALVRANMALYDFCKSYAIPLISGKDSMKNDYGTGKNKISIPPTLLFTLISKIEDVNKMVSMDIKGAGNFIYMTGETKDEMGASEYFAYNGMKNKGFVPKVNAEKFFESYRMLHRAMTDSLVESAHDVSEGGLGVAAAEAAFSGGFGMKIDLAKVKKDGKLADIALLFSESNGRIIVEVKPENRDKFEKIMAGTDISLIGETCGSDVLKITGQNGGALINISLSELKKSWKAPLEKLK